MKSSFMLVATLITLLVSSAVIVSADDTNPCEQISVLYENKVAENVKLNQEKKDLDAQTKKDATTISKLRDDANKAQSRITDLESRLVASEAELKRTKQLLSACRGDSAKLQKELNSKKIVAAEQYQKQVKDLQRQLDSVKNSNTELRDTIAEREKQIEKLKEEIAIQEGIREFYVQHFVKSSVDELYATSSINELERCREVLKMMDVEIPPTIGQTIICFEARDLLLQKYNKAKIDQVLKQLPMDTAIGKKLAQSLQRYANMNAEASAVWASIQKEIFAKPVDTSNDHKHLYAKRQIWQMVQKFYNKYPTLLKDYPYIHEQYQVMLRAIWENANNFTKMANPFI